MTFHNSVYTSAWALWYVLDRVIGLLPLFHSFHLIQNLGFRQFLSTPMLGLITVLLSVANLFIILAPSVGIFILIFVLTLVNYQQQVLLQDRYNQVCEYIVFLFFVPAIFCGISVLLCSPSLLVLSIIVTYSAMSRNSVTTPLLEGVVTLVIAVCLSEADIYGVAFFCYGHGIYCLILDLIYRSATKDYFASRARFMGIPTLIVKSGPDLTDIVQDRV